MTRISPLACAKILMHATKYAHCDVVGAVLVAEGQVVDVVPLSHNPLTAVITDSGLAVVRGAAGGAAGGTMQRGMVWRGAVIPRRLANRSQSSRQQVAFTLSNPPCLLCARLSGWPRPAAHGSPASTSDGAPQRRMCSAPCTRSSQMRCRRTPAPRTRSCCRCESGRAAGAGVVVMCVGVLQRRPLPPRGSPQISRTLLSKPGAFPLQVRQRAAPHSQHAPSLAPSAR